MKYMNQVEQIAKTCHEVHNVVLRIYMNTTIPWEDKSEAHKEVVRDSVLKILNGDIKSPQQAHVNFVAKRLKKDGHTALSILKKIRQVLEYASSKICHPKTCGLRRLSSPR